MMPSVIPLYPRPSGALSTRRLIDLPLVKGADSDRAPVSRLSRLALCSRSLPNLFRPGDGAIGASSQGAPTVSSTGSKTDPKI